MVNVYARAGASESRAGAIAVVLAFAGIVVGYSCSYASIVTAFVLPLTHEFGWGRVIPSLMFSAAMLGMALASFFLGQIIERLGVATVAALSGCSLATVMVFLGNMTGSTSTAVCLGFLAGLLGAGTGVGVYVSILPKFFNRHLGLALGLSVAGQSIGSMVMPPLAAAVIDTQGWRQAYLVMAGVLLGGTLSVALLLWLFSCKTHGTSFSENTDGLELKEALRLSSFWILQVTIFLQTLGMFGITPHIFPIFADRGVARSALPSLAVALSGGMFLGRIGSGLLLDRVDARVIAAVNFTIGGSAIACLAILKSTHGLALYLPPIAIGVALGAETDILAYMTRRYYGQRHFAIIYNRLLVGYFLGSMSGPLVVSWAFDHSLSQQVALSALATSCIIAALLVGKLPTTKRHGPLFHATSI